jgi:hypothetical protein
MIRLWEFLFLLMIVFITMIHAKRFNGNEPVGPLFHAVWAAVYFIPVAILVWKFDSWWLGIAALVERFVFYDPILNIFRGKPFFYLSTASANPSFWDKIEISLGKAYPYIWVFSVIIFIVLQLPFALRLL